MKKTLDCVGAKVQGKFCARARFAIRKKDAFGENKVFAEVNCPYCGKLYNEVLRVCPYRGGKQ